MPRWALGRVCDLMVELVRIQRTEAPHVEPAAVVVFAGDHGVTAEGVSAYPREVTRQMIVNFLDGGAAICVLARQHGLPMWVVDMGSAGPALDGDRENYVPVRLQPGTANFVQGPAMWRATAGRAIEEGRSVLKRLASSDAPPRTLIPGEMGIGNTTSASALTALVLDVEPRLLVGKGTGIDDATYARKLAVVENGVNLHRPVAKDPLAVLAAVGGLEIAGLVGLILEAAQRRCIVVLDGFIVSVAALLADRIDSTVREVLIAGHASPEPGHRLVLDALGLEPILDLGLRLGEASGAALAWPIVQSAARLFREMATFDEANVADRTKDE